MPGPSTSPHQTYTPPPSGSASMPTSSPGYDPTAQRATSSFADRARAVFEEMKKNAAADVATGCKDCGGCSSTTCKAKDVGAEYKKAPPEVHRDVRAKMDSYSSFGNGTVFDKAAASMGPSPDVKMDNKTNPSGDPRVQNAQTQATAQNGADFVSGIGRVGASNGSSHGSFGGPSQSQASASQQRSDSRNAETKPSESRGAEPKATEGRETKAETKAEAKAEAKPEAKQEKGAEASRTEKRVEATSSQAAPSANATPRPDVKAEPTSARSVGRAASEEELLRAAEAVRKMNDAVKKVESVFVKTGADGQTSFADTKASAAREHEALAKAVKNLAEAVAAGEKLSADLQRASHRVGMLDKMLSTGPSGMNPETVARLVKSSLPEIKSLIPSNTPQVERRVETQSVNRVAPAAPAPSRPPPVTPQQSARPSFAQQYSSPSRPATSAAVRSGPALTAGMRQVDTRPAASVGTRTASLNVSSGVEMSARRAAFNGQIAHIRAGLNRIQGNIAAAQGRSTIGGFSRRPVNEQQTFDRQVNRVDPRVSQRATRANGTERPTSLRERLMERADKMRQSLERTLKKLDRTGAEVARKKELTPAERRERAIKRLDAKEQRELRRQKEEAKLTPAERRERAIRRMERLEKRREEREMKRGKDGKLDPDKREKGTRRLDARERELRRKDGKLDTERTEKGDRRERMNRRIEDRKLEAGRDKRRGERDLKDKKIEKRAERQEQNEQKLARQLKKGNEGVTLNQREVNTLISLLNNKKAKKTVGQEEDSIAGMLSPMEQRALAKILKKLPKDASLDVVRKSLKKERKKNGAVQQASASPTTKKQQGNAAQPNQQTSAEGKVTADQQPSKSLDLNTSKVGDGKGGETQPNENGEKKYYDAEHPLAV